MRAVDIFRLTQDYGIEPSVVLCTCMVDVLVRAGQLEEAKLLMDKMPVEPNGGTWGALLGGCRTYGNVELMRRIWVQSQSSGFHGLSALLSPCPCLLKYESVDQSGVYHFHRFGRDHLRISLL